MIKPNRLTIRYKTKNSSSITWSVHISLASCNISFYLITRLHLLTLGRKTKRKGKNPASQTRKDFVLLKLHLLSFKQWWAIGWMTWTRKANPTNLLCAFTWHFPTKVSLNACLAAKKKLLLRFDSSRLVLLRILNKDYVSCTNVRKVQPFRVRLV